jgi:hypothetical protein
MSVTAVCHVVYLALFEGRGRWPVRVRGRAILAAWPFADWLLDYLDGIARVGVFGGSGLGSGGAAWALGALQRPSSGVNLPAWLQEIQRIQSDPGLRPASLHLCPTSQHTCM